MTIKKVIKYDDEAQVIVYHQKSCPCRIWAGNRHVCKIGGLHCAYDCEDHFPKDCPLQTYEEGIDMNTDNKKKIIKVIETNGLIINSYRECAYRSGSTPHICLKSLNDPILYCNPQDRDNCNFPRACPLDDYVEKKTKNKPDSYYSIVRNHGESDESYIHRLCNSNGSLRKVVFDVRKENEKLQKEIKRLNNMINNARDFITDATCLDEEE